jgi:hypothetical protein
MKQKKIIHIPALLAVIFTAALASCRVGFVEPAGSQSESTGTTQNTVPTSGTAFGAKWIIDQQEQHNEEETIRKGYSIVKTATSFNEAAFTNLNSSVVSAIDLHDGYRYFLIKTETEAAAFRTAIRKMDGVLYAQPDYHYDAPATVEDDNAIPPYRKPKTTMLKPFGTQEGNLHDDPKGDLADWGLTVTGALEAFRRYDAHDAVQQVLVAIIDSGVNSLHEDFYDAKIHQSIIFYAKSSLHKGSSGVYNPLMPIPLTENWDDVGHGTHCSGTIAAIGNNSKGICGVSHANTKLITYRGIGKEGGSHYSIYACLGDLAEIITELRKEPALRDDTVFTGLPPQVKNSPKLTQKTIPVNLSLGGYAIHPFEVEMMNKALAAGVLPVIAMGNDGKTLAVYPAALQGVLAVGATTMDDTHAAFSNGGSWISVCAPGESIYSCGNGGSSWSNPTSPAVKESYRWLSGTSMATPFVTGTVTYLLSIRPDLSGYQLKTILENTADKIDQDSPYGQYDSRGFSKWYGYGRVNVLKAAEAVQTGTGIPAVGSVYSEKAVKITVMKASTVQKKMPVWLYEKRSGICAAVGLTDEQHGTVSFYGLRTGFEYEIGVNDAGVYKTHSITAPTDSDIDYTFSL